MKLRNFWLDHPAEITSAIDLYEVGLDFGDAPHLAMCHGDDELFTLDRQFANHAQREGAVPPVGLP